MDRRTLLLLAAAVVLASTCVVYVLVEARIKVDGRGDTEYECSGSTDPYCLCMAIIGDENTCRANKTDPDGEVTSWGAECDQPDSCKAWIDCPNGSHKECRGEYKVQSDESGIWCQDTGDDTLATRDYCPE